MSLTAQTISTFIAALALCLAIQDSPARLGDIPSPPEKPGNSTIRGVVTYADTGRPVRYATVIVLGDEGNGPWASGIVTNRNGEFVVKHVPAGRYIVFVSLPGILQPIRLPGTMGPLTAGFRLSGEPFTEAVVNGTDSVDVKVQAVRGGVITGRVVTEDDQPVANADIKLLKRENGKWTPLEPPWYRSLGTKFKTDPSGVYRVAGLDAGEYLVRVSEGIVSSDEKSPPEEGAYTKGYLMAVYHPSATIINDAQAVSVIEGSETMVDIRMPDRTAHKISGTLTFGKDNEPAAYADILVERRDEIAYPDPESNAAARSDENGKWEVPGVPEGEYSIRFGGSIQVKSSDNGYMTLAPKRIRVRVEHDDVVVPDTKLSQGGSISGRVTLNGKLSQRFLRVYAQPISEKRTSVSTFYDRRSLAGSPLDVPMGYVQDDGTFWIVGLPPGKYAIVVSVVDNQEYYVKSITRKGADLTQSPLKVQGESVIEGVTISLGTDFATVEGRLMVPDASPKKVELRDTVVILAPANDTTRRFSRDLLMAQPDAEGKFVITCAPGEYFLTAVTSGEIKQLASPIDEDYFKNDNQKFERVKVKAGEKIKGLTVSAGSN
jgi:hypothetical protein